MIIKNCNIIDCTGRAPYKATVKVTNGLITDIITDCANTIDDDTVIDARDKYLMPGLINSHVHINRRHVSRANGAFRNLGPTVENSTDGRRMMYAAKNAWYELNQGITSMRDLCSVGRSASELKAAFEDGIIRGPRLVVCGKAIACTGGHETHMYKGAVEVDGPDAVMQAVRNEIRLGADFIKLMACGGIAGMPEHENPDMVELTEEEIRAACTAAHDHNKKVTVHAYGIKPVMNSLRGGVDGIEHGVNLNDEALDIMCEHSVYYVPTMTTVTGFIDKERSVGHDELADLITKEVMIKHFESVSRAHEKGILIAAGSDTLGELHKEMYLLEEMGLNRMEVLQTATINAAKELQMDNKIGTLEVGKEADLLLLGSNPLDNLHNLNDVKEVYCRGEHVTYEWMLNLQ